MKHFFMLFAHLLTTIAKLMRSHGYRRVIAESLLLKHQLLILQRRHKRAPNLSAWDRLFLGFSASLLSKHRIKKMAIALKPATLLAFHRALVSKKYRKLYSQHHHVSGPQGPSADVVGLIVGLKQRNPRFGCPRIAKHITHIFGISIDKDVVRRVLEKHYQPIKGGGGPSWLTFFAHLKDSLWSVDFFRCESIHLRSYWVMVVMDIFTRRIIGFAAVPANMDGQQVCDMFTRATRDQNTPCYLSTDNDPLFRYHQWRANLSTAGINEIKSIPYTPISHPFVERLIGTIRREYLDHTFFFNQSDLERKLDTFKVYYNDFRVHSSLSGVTPAEKSGGVIQKQADIKKFTWRKHCNDLFQLPSAA